MKHTFLTTLASVTALTVASTLAYADTVVRSSQTTSASDGLGSSSYRSTETTNVVPAPVDTTIRSRVETRQDDGMGTASATVTERTETGALAPSAGSSKRVEINESNAYGDQKRVVKQQSVNGDGYMAREEYSVKKNY